MKYDWYRIMWKLGVIVFIIYLLTGVWKAFANDEALTPSERIVALTILGEARGEGKCGSM